MMKFYRTLTALQKRVLESRERRNWKRATKSLNFYSKETRFQSKRGGFWIRNGFNGEYQRYIPKINGEMVTIDKSEDILDDWNHMVS